METKKKTLTIKSLGGNQVLVIETKPTKAGRYVVDKKIYDYDSKEFRNIQQQLINFIYNKRYDDDWSSVFNKENKTYIFATDDKQYVIGEVIGKRMLPGDVIPSKKNNNEKPFLTKKRKKGIAITMGLIILLTGGSYVLKRRQPGDRIGGNYDYDKSTGYNDIYKELKENNKLFDLRKEAIFESKLTDFAQYVTKIPGVNYTADECMKILVWLNELDHGLNINYDEEILEKISQIVEANHLDIVQHRFMGTNLEQSYFERNLQQFVSDKEGNAFLAVLSNKINECVKAEYEHDNKKAEESAKELFDFIVDTYFLFEQVDTSIGKVQPDAIPNPVKVLGLSEAYASLITVHAILGLDYSVEREMSDGMGGTKLEKIGIKDMNQVINDQLQKLNLRFDPADKENQDVIVEGIDDNVFVSPSKDGETVKKLTNKPNNIRC